MHNSLQTQFYSCKINCTKVK